MTAPEANGTVGVHPPPLTTNPLSHGSAALERQHLRIP